LWTSRPDGYIVAWAGPPMVRSQVGGDGVAAAAGDSGAAASMPNATATNGAVHCLNCFRRKKPSPSATRSQGVQPRRLKDSTCGRRRIPVQKSLIVQLEHFDPVVPLVGHVQSACCDLEVRRVVELAVPGARRAVPLEQGAGG